MPETTDTNPNIFPEGKRRFTVAGVPKKKKTDKGHTYYEWQFECNMDGELRDLKLFFWPSEMKELLLAVGGKEDPEKKGHITWEKEEVNGKSIEATIVHIPQKKDPTKMDAKMKEIAEGLPF